MTDREIQNLDAGIALSRQFAKQQMQAALVVGVSAALTFFLTHLFAPGISGLGLAIGAATGLTVGVWCQPDSYRRRNGSLLLAFVLIAFMWTAPVLILLTTFAG